MTKKIPLSKQIQMYYDYDKKDKLCFDGNDELELNNFITLAKELESRLAQIQKFSEVLKNHLQVRHIGINLETLLNGGILGPSSSSNKAEVEKK